MGGDAERVRVSFLSAFESFSATPCRSEHRPCRCACPGQNLRYRESAAPSNTDVHPSYGPQGVTRSTFSLLSWSERPEIETAWKELSEKHSLQFDPFKDRAQVFGMTDSAIIGGWALSLSMRKARKMGWHGCVDSYEAMFHTIRDLGRLKVTPPMHAREFDEE